MIDFKKIIEEEDKQTIKEERRNNGEAALTTKKNRWITVYTIAIISLAVVFAGRILASSLTSSDWSANNIFGSFKHLTPLGNKVMKGENNDRINILLLGMGGAGHDGPYLTDTMMLLSLKPSTKQIALISIPRDLVSPVNNWEKINSIDAYAEAKNPGSGGEVTAQDMSKLLNIPIQYYVRADFSGFVNIINELGGIQVDVQHTLDDYQYPIAGQEDNPNYAARFEHLHIAKGPQTMDGALALAYARSRHAVGIEGSDFARSKRQQLILEAVKTKLLSSKTLLNPVMITKVLDQLNKSISTNLSPWEMLHLWNIFKDVKHSQIINQVLSDAPNNFLVAGRGQDGAFILMPRSGNFTDIQNFIKNIFSENLNSVTNSSSSPTIKDGAHVVILNGTWINGLASKNAVLLEQAKFNVSEITNAPTRNNAKSLVYDLSGDTKAADLSVLEKITGATVSSNYPNWLNSYKSVTAEANSSTNTSSSSQNSKLASSSQRIKTDFVVLLGTDSNKAQ